MLVPFNRESCSVSESSALHHLSLAGVEHCRKIILVCCFFWPAHSETRKVPAVASQVCFLSLWKQNELRWKRKKKEHSLRILGLGGCKLLIDLPVLIPLNQQMLFTSVSLALWKLLTSLSWPMWFESLPLSHMGIKILSWTK